MRSEPLATIRGSSVGTDRNATWCRGLFRALAPTGESLHGEAPKWGLALLQWNDPNQRAVSFELEWRFSDVPYWVHLGSTSSETIPSRAPFQIGIASWNLAEYCYRGRAVLGDSTSEWSDEVCDRMDAGEPHTPPIWPAPATDVTAEAIPEGIRLTWSCVEYDGNFGLPDALVLRQESSEGAYDVIGTLLYGTFEFTDDEGNRDHCYRIGTKIEDRGKSVSGDVCPR